MVPVCYCFHTGSGGSCKITVTFVTTVSDTQFDCKGAGRNRDSSACFLRALPKHEVTLSRV